MKRRPSVRIQRMMRNSGGSLAARGIGGIDVLSIAVSIVRNAPAIANTVIRYYSKIYRKDHQRFVLRNAARERGFYGLVNRSQGKRCLQIGLAGTSRVAPHFEVLDLYDPSPEIDYQYDVGHMPDIATDSYDVVICNAILDGLSNPSEALEEMRRILRPGGEIWIEAGFVQPYHPSPKDYWRVTVDGLRIWTSQKFEEIDSGFFGNPLYNGVFYHASKPR